MQAGREMTIHVDMRDMQARADEVSGLLKLLSHPTRLLIVCELRKGEASVSALEEATGATQSNLSRDLGRMREEGLITARRQSKSVYYRLADDRLARVIDALCAAFGSKPRKSVRKAGT